MKLNLNDLIKKLDLKDYILSLSANLSRDKSIFLDGDINIHYKFINSLEDVTYIAPPHLQNLDSQLMNIKKHGILKLDEIVEFIKIINYFIYLKNIRFDGVVKEWLYKIIIPEPILDIANIFDKKYLIKEFQFEELDAIKSALLSNKEKIKMLMTKTLNNSKLSLYLVDRQIHTLHEEESLLMRGGFNNVLKGTTIGRSSNGFFYVVPQNISELKDKRRDIINKYDEILFKITKDISLTFFNNIMFLDFINKAYDRFDHYNARVTFAKNNELEFMLPQKDSKIVLNQYIHPALHNPKPINLDFSTNILLLTGVNAGGKTMILKSILSAVFMSKYLLPQKLNKNSSHIGSFKGVFAILDDPQNVKNDISTFAGRMVEFSTLFNKKNLLIGVDEIELGTDSDEAASLFKVILQKLKLTSKIVITTHHKRLAALLSSDSDVTLAAALYDEQRRVPTYEFLFGTIGQSYAFETALRYNIPPHIVQEAKIVYGEDKDKLNDLIQRSSSLELELKLKQQKLNDELKEINNLKQELKEIKDGSYKTLKTQKFNLDKTYYEAKEEVKKAIKSSKSDAHRHLNKAHEKIKNITIKNNKQAEDLKEGDNVKYHNSKAKILSIDKKRVYIELDNGIKLRCKLNELSFNITPKVKHNQTIYIQKPSSASIKLDLHGQRAEEALENLDKFISDSLIAGFDEIIVYHGIGSGKLSALVKEFLETHLRVSSFNDAPPSLGGFGAKVIQL